MNINAIISTGIRPLHSLQSKDSPGSIRTCSALLQTAALCCFISCAFLCIRASADECSNAGQGTKPGVGYLKVFSATEQAPWGEGSYYFLHTGYRIYDSKGKVVKWVENHQTFVDETPQEVALAPGSYTIWAQSEKDGYVKVLVTIRSNQTSTIQLEETRVSNKDFTSTNKAMKIPEYPATDGNG